MKPELTDTEDASEGEMRRCVARLSLIYGGGNTKDTPTNL